MECVILLKTLLHWPVVRAIFEHYKVRLCEDQTTGPKAARALCAPLWNRVEYSPALPLWEGPAPSGPRKSARAFP